MASELHSSRSRAEDVSLISFLGCCQNDWGPRDLQQVQRKLAAIGVIRVTDLSRHLQDQSLNSKLESLGERRFADETVKSMRRAFAQIGAGVDSLGCSPASRPRISGIADTLDDDFSRLLSFDLPSQTAAWTSYSASAAPSPRQSRKSVRASSKPSPLLTPISPPPIKPSTAPSAGSRTPGRRANAAWAFSGRPVTADYQAAPAGGPMSSDDDGMGDKTPNSARAATFLNPVGKSSDIFASPHVVRKQIRRGLQSIEHTAKEARRRDRAVAKCLAEVQADIQRVRRKMSEARQRKSDGFEQKSDPSTARQRSSRTSGTSAVAAGASTARAESQSMPTSHPSTARQRSSATSGTSTTSGTSAVAAGASTARAESQSMPTSQSNQSGGYRASTAPTGFGRTHRGDSSLRGSANTRGIPKPAAPCAERPCQAPEQDAEEGSASFYGLFANDGFGQSSPKKNADRDGCQTPKAAREHAFGQTPVAEEDAESAEDDRSDVTADDETDLLADARRPHTARVFDSVAASEVRRAVHAQLLTVKNASDADQRLVVKRLLVEWHPDRNPSRSDLATDVFQYIQQEKERILGRM